MTVTNGWRMSMRIETTFEHPELVGWKVTQLNSEITMTTPEGELVHDRFGKPWQFQSLEDAYQFAVRAMDSEGA